MMKAVPVIPTVLYLYRHHTGKLKFFMSENARFQNSNSSRKLLPGE